MAGAVVQRAGLYNYSPSVMQTGNLQQFWWCSNGQNPSNPGQDSDTIFYESIDTVTHETIGPLIALSETAGAWDADYTCNPRVIRGSFANPLGNGESYTYEMFYVATANPVGEDNSIGAAFSNDGIVWDKYPEPVIGSTSRSGYGVGQPAAYNEDEHSAITLYYEDNTPYIHHVKATSQDGLHFTVQGTLTRNGLDPNNSAPSWGDMGFDRATGYWYAAFDLGYRNPATNEGVGERGQYGIQLYRIPNASLLSGAAPWEMLKTIDTNTTGYESNFLPGLLHDMYGTINIGQYPKIQVYPSISDPQPAWNASPEKAALSGIILNWYIGSFVWTPNQPRMALKRYSNLITYEVTTGWTDPNAGFKHLTLAHLYESPQNGASLAFYGCKSGSTDYFMSTDVGCEGQRVLGLEGYGYAQPAPSLKLVPLYRCATGGPATFVSLDANCEARGRGLLLGYALP